MTICFRARLISAPPHAEHQRQKLVGERNVVASQPVIGHEKPSSPATLLGWRRSAEASLFIDRTAEKAAKWCVGSNLERYKWKPPEASDSSPHTGESAARGRAVLPTGCARAHKHIEIGFPQ